MSTIAKERKLKHNVEVNTARAINVRQQELKRELTEGEKSYYRQEFETSAHRIDSTGKLATVWNGKQSKSESGKRPALGYFGGVNFDKNGRIIREN